LTQLQLQYKQLRAIKQFFETGTWLSSITKQEFRTLASLASKVFIEKKTNWFGSGWKIFSIQEQ